MRQTIMKIWDKLYVRTDKMLEGPSNKATTGINKTKYSDSWQVFLDNFLFVPPPDILDTIGLGIE